MPDIGEQLSAILQNPEAQKNIRALLSSMQPQQPPPQNENPLQNILAGLQGGLSPPQPEPPPSFGGIDINTLMKMQQIFSHMECDDKGVCLLKALKPYLHDPQKVDGAIQMLQLMSVLPALSECGIFGGNR